MVLYYRMSIIFHNISKYFAAQLTFIHHVVVPRVDRGYEENLRVLAAIVLYGDLGGRGGQRGGPGRGERPLGPLGLRAARAPTRGSPAVSDLIAAVLDMEPSLGGVGVVGGVATAGLPPPPTPRPPRLSPPARGRVGHVSSPGRPGGVTAGEVAGLEALTARPGGVARHLGVDGGGAAGGGGGEPGATTEGAVTFLTGHAGLPVTVARLAQLASLRPPRLHHARPSRRLLLPAAAVLVVADRLVGAGCPALAAAHVGVVHQVLLRAGRDLAGHDDGTADVGLGEDLPAGGFV